MGTQRKTKSAEVQFTHDPAARRIIRQIADRAHRLLDYDRFCTEMDVNATHCNGNPLCLADLLSADDLNFIHDVGGIARHLDRETGKLTGHFSPRFSKREVEAA